MLLAQRQARAQGWPLPHELLYIWGYTGVMHTPVLPRNPEVSEVLDELGIAKDQSLVVLDPSQRIEAVKACANFFASKKVSHKVEMDSSNPEDSAEVTRENARERLFTRMVGILDGLARAREVKTIEGRAEEVQS